MPVDRGAIDAQLREIGEGERWWEQREFRELPHILHPDERIRALVNGRLPGPRRPRFLPSRPWLVVATDQRLVFLREERFGRQQIDLRLDRITGLRHRPRLRGYRIVLETRERRYRVRIPKADAFRFLGALESLLPHPDAERTGAGGPPLPRVPGVGRIAALPGVSSLVSAWSVLSPPDPVSQGDLARVVATVERLEAEVERLQQQVEFLEKLLHKQAEGVGSAPGSAAGR